MKYIIETEKLDREHDEVISEIMDKMYAIEDNLEFLSKEYQRQFPNEITSVILNTFSYTKQICVDLCSANDEFYIESKNNCIFLEVVTEKIAQLNDNDFLSDVSAEDLKKENYHLGDGNYSYYTKLADTDYYFRFM